MNMKISFVIPAYNEERYIGDCLRSVLKQIKKSGCEAEVIVVNNASTDKTKEIALSFKDVRVVDEFRKGLLWAREAGFRASSGDLIANVDSDTKLTPRWIDKVFKEFNKNKKLAALSGPCIYYDLPFYVRVAVSIFYFFGYLIYSASRLLFKSGVMLQGGNSVLRRSALEKIGGFDTRISFYGEDTDTARRISKVGSVKFTFDLPIYTTGRRMATEGILFTGARYAINYLWVLFLKKPFSKSYEDIRNN